MDGSRQMAYNPPPVMGLKARGVVPLLAGALVIITALTGCMGARATDRTVAESGGSFVRVERDPSASRGLMYGHPVSLSPERVRAFLGGIDIESRVSFLSGVSTEPLFDHADLDFLAPAVSAALQQARPDERVVFYLRQSGRLLRPEITTGAVSVMGTSLRFTLGHFRRTDIEGLVEENRSAGLEREVRGDPMYGVYDRGVRIFARNDEGLRGDADARSVRFRLTASGLGPEAPPAARRDAPAPAQAAAGAPDATSLKDLQQQIKTLTESNQDLRAKLQELQERREQFQDRSTVATEELARLRQELAEIKQLLAEKVLELNRLKNKSGGTDKGGK